MANQRVPTQVLSPYTGHDPSTTDYQHQLMQHHHLVDCSDTEFLVSDTAVTAWSQSDMRGVGNTKQSIKAASGNTILGQFKARILRVVSRAAVHESIKHDNPIRAVITQVARRPAAENEFSKPGAEAVIGLARDDDESDYSRQLREEQSAGEHRCFHEMLNKFKISVLETNDVHQIRGGIKTDIISPLSDYRGNANQNNNYRTDANRQHHLLQQQQQQQSWLRQTAAVGPCHGTRPPVAELSLADLQGSDNNMRSLQRREHVAFRQTAPRVSCVGDVTWPTGLADQRLSSIVEFASECRGKFQSVAPKRSRPEGVTTVTTSGVSQDSDEAMSYSPENKRRRMTSLASADMFLEADEQQNIAVSSL